MKKKILLTFILSIFSVLILGSFSVSAATYGYLSYEVSGGKAIITGYSLTAYGDLEIPSHISGYPVTEIDDDAFYQCNLENVTIPNTVTRIGNGAFSYSGVDSIIIPDSVTSIGDGAFYCCSGLKGVTIGDNVKSIGKNTFYFCNNLESITLGKGITSIGDYAFSFCESLTTVNYNGEESSWNKISIGSNNSYLTKATKKYFWYVTLYNDKGELHSKTKYTHNSVLDLTSIPEKFEHSVNVYTNKTCTMKYASNAPITKDLVLYYKYKLKEYVVKFYDEDGTLIKKYSVAYGSKIPTPENPTKDRTQKYSYTFVEWNGYVDEMIMPNYELAFTATYTAIINQYTYKFLDEDGCVLKEETVDYGTTITPPEINDKTEYYLFDYWQGYTEGMTITENVTFKAVFKYKNYSVNVEGLLESIIVTYNSNFVIKPQMMDDYHYFIGYFTEENGKGTQITNEKGESLSVYNIVGDLKVYPYFYEGYINKVELQCVKTAMPGDTITQSAIFATDKNALYMSVTIKYPEFLNYKDVKGIDFVRAEKGTEKTDGEYKLLTIDCIYDYSGVAMPVNKNLVPFEIEFDVSTDVPIGNYNIVVEKATLLGNSNYEITDFVNSKIEFLPKFAESIEIIGNVKIDKKTQFIAVVSPDYTTDKSVVWSVDKESVATISRDGILTPVTNGDVIITVTAKDGSGVFATKSVQVVAYAKIDSFDFGEGTSLPTFDPDNREYTVYVSEDTETITLTPSFLGGTLIPNGEGIWFPGTSKTFELANEETIITLSRESVNNMTNSVYTVKVIKADGQKTTVSNSGKTFVIRSHDLSVGNRVFLALYDGERMVDVQTAIYDGEIIIFTTTETYTNAKVMVWDSLTNIKPVCDVEIVK